MIFKHPARFTFLFLVTLPFICLAQNSSKSYYDTPNGLVSVDDANKKEIDELKPKAEKGDAEAQYSLGGVYSWAGNGKEAMKWFRRAATNGNVYAASRLGLIFEDHKDYKQAFFWYLKAAKGGEDRAQWKISEMYSDGEGVKPDNKEAEKWHARAIQTEADYVNGLKEKALKGDVKAQLEMAEVYSYRNNLAIKSDSVEANKWYLMAAKQNNTQAMFSMGLAFENGNGVKKDFSEAFRWYMKAALLGDEDGELQVGCMYLHGVGIQKDLKEAAKWFLKSARQGNVYAAYKIANVYEDDMKLNISPEELKAFLHRGMIRGDSYDPYSPRRLEMEKKFRVENN